MTAIPQRSATDTTTPLFGTDGIRGTANRFPMTADLALALGMAAGLYFNRGKHRHRVVIAKDTRLSGYMIESALTSGFLAAGMDVLQTGPLPTPAVAMLVRSMRADLGVMISASHNPHHDNGIKLFGPDGYKLTDEQEKAIEALIHTIGEQTLTTPEHLGRAKRILDAHGRYIEFAKNTFPGNRTLEGIKIVLDCAHGAAYYVGPLILSELGAEVISIGVKPDGFNINAECGSTAPALLAETVKSERAHIGIALDGDADRVIICDETGQIIDGDQILALIAEYWQRHGMLKGKGVVATVMSNMGLERHLAALGLTLARTKVGDRYVLEHMRAEGFNIGGEQSGHIILSDFSTTGDGLVAALQILAVLAESGKKMSEIGHVFEPLPQLLKNIRFTGPSPLERTDVKRAIADAEKALGTRGRILVRLSGTEPLIRVMAEGEDKDEIERVVEGIVKVLGHAS